MKKVFNVTKLLFGQLNKSIQSRPCLSSRAFEHERRFIKIESENKAIVSNILPSIIGDRTTATSDDWKAIRNKLLGSERPLSPINIDTFILNFCLYRENYTLAYSYFDFLKEEQLKPNLATIGKYFRLFYMANRNKSLEANEELNVIEKYKELWKTYQALDAVTCENVVHALSITKYWKECLRLLDEIKISSVPNANTYSVIASAAFANGETELGWKLLKEAFDNNRHLLSSSYLSYLKQCEQLVLTSDFLVKTERLFEFFKEYDIKCEDKVANSISSLYTKFNLNSKITRIDVRGQCLNCRQKLDKFELNDTEFKHLKQEILNNVIVGKDVFLKSSPTELNQFQQFISSMKQYDVVIDGLNVAYSAGTKHNPSVFASLLTSVVKHFVNQNMKVLVLGRAHMRKWPRRNWEYITQNSDTFLAQSLTHDDPYLLYCALHSGLNTIIVTKDLMRSHVFKLKDLRVKILFNQWLTQSVYQLRYVDNKGRVHFKYPLPYISTPQKHQNSWHIPLIQEDEFLDSKWLCLKR